MMTCPSCGNPDGILDFQFDIDAVKQSWKDDPLCNRPLNIWRYRELLPLASDHIPDNWPVGWTPILNSPRLAQSLGISQLIWKDESRGLTASFKDRASAVAVAHAQMQGAKIIACSSTGNAATSLAGYASLAGLQSVIFVPQSAPKPKLTQILIYNATLFSVQGSYHDAYQLCSSACERFGWYNRNCAINPVMVEGKKTAGLEIAEQCGVLGGIPDWISVSVGDGCSIAGVWKGISHAHKLGIIDKLPQLLAVQASDVSPVSHAFHHGSLPSVVSGSTLADSINVSHPRNWRKAVNAVRESDGTFVSVTDREISRAQKEAGKHGIFAEPAAAASVAGVANAIQQGIIQSHHRVLCLITGGGLKDTNAALDSCDSPIEIEPNIQSLVSSLPPTFTDKNA